MSWSTGSESEHSGFLIWRAVAESHDFVRLTPALMTPPGPYQYVDTQVTPGATYYYRLEAIDRFGGSEFFGPVEATAVGAAGSPGFTLLQSHPNPFEAERGATMIGFTLGQRVPVKLRIFDTTGRLVRLLVDEPLDGGMHTALWDGRNDGGAEAGSGIYYYRLDAGEFSESRPLVNLR